jgi:hypothetical protein
MDGPIDGMVDKKCRSVVNEGAVVLSQQMGLMLVMGCRGNVGVVSRAVVESQDGVSGTGRRGRMDRERGDGEVYGRCWRRG